VTNLTSFFQEVADKNAEDTFLALSHSAASSPAELLVNVKNTLIEIDKYLNSFLQNNCLTSFLITKQYSVLLIQIHQSILSFLKDLKLLLGSAAGGSHNPPLNTASYDKFFGDTYDLHSNDIIRRFNDDFFFQFLFSSPEDIYLQQFAGMSSQEKYELLSIVFTEITADQLQHLLSEFNKFKSSDPIPTLISKIKNTISTYIIEESIATEDLVVNLNDVITDGMFGKICLGTLKNAERYSTSVSTTAHKKGAPIRVGIELVSLNEPFLHKQRFGREIDALRKLSNAKCVLKIYGWIPLESSTLNTDRPVIGIVTETWHRTLTSLVLDETFEPTVDVWLKYLIDIIKALSHIKRSGIVYRTLKADSIVITSTNVAVISDLSLTFNQNYITTRTTITNTFKVDSTNQQIVGSIGFTAPETYKGKVYDTTDVYSLGILISFVLFRESPWADEHHTVTYSPQMTREPKFLTQEELPSFQDSNLQIWRKCCNLNHKQRSSLVDVEQAMKKEYQEVSKQLKILSRTKSQLNVMTNVQDIATIQGVPIPKVPTLHRTASTMTATNKSMSNDSALSGSGGYVIQPEESIVQKAGPGEFEDLVIPMLGEGLDEEDLDKSSDEIPVAASLSAMNLLSPNDLNISRDSNSIASDDDSVVMETVTPDAKQEALKALSGEGEEVVHSPNIVMTEVKSNFYFFYFRILNLLISFFNLLF
jgi:serine/threonine protein kinase